MRDFIIALMSLILVIFGIKIVMMDIRIRNLEHMAVRIEQGYSAVITENEKLVRMNDQTLRIVTEGGWNADVFGSRSGN